MPLTDEQVHQSFPECALDAETLAILRPAVLTGPGLSAPSGQLAAMLDFDVSVSVVPVQARTEWAELAAVLAASGPAACEVGNAEDWWPPANRGAPMRWPAARSVPLDGRAWPTRWPPTSGTACGAPRRPSSGGSWSATPTPPEHQSAGVISNPSVSTTHSGSRPQFLLRPVSFASTRSGGATTVHSRPCHTSW